MMWTYLRNNPNNQWDSHYFFVVANLLLVACTGQVNYDFVDNKSNSPIDGLSYSVV